MSIRDQANTQSVLSQLLKDLRDVIVQLEVLARSPLPINLARAGVDVRSRPAHPLDDVFRVREEDLGIVHIARTVEQRPGAGDARLELRSVHVHPVTRAESLIPFSAKRR